MRKHLYNLSSFSLTLSLTISLSPVTCDVPTCSLVPHRRFFGTSFFKISLSACREPTFTFVVVCTGRNKFVPMFPYYMLHCPSLSSLPSQSPQPQLLPSPKSGNLLYKLNLFSPPLWLLDSRINSHFLGMPVKPK